MLPKAPVQPDVNTWVGANRIAIRKMLDAERKELTHIELSPVNIL